MKLPVAAVHVGSCNFSAEDKSTYQVKVVCGTQETEGFCDPTYFPKNSGMPKFINCIACLMDVSNSAVFNWIVHINSC